MKKKKNIVKNLRADNEILEISEEQMKNFVGNIIFLKSNTNETHIVMSNCAYKSLFVNQLKILEKKVLDLEKPRGFSWGALKP